MFTSEEIKQWKSRIKTEMARRNGYGSLARFAGAAYDFDHVPAPGEPILAEHGRKTVNPMLNIKDYREGDAAYNQVKRGDLKFVKVGEKNMHRFANVAFKLTSQTTGESHILLTDANGEVRTETKWNAHSLNTNGNDDKPEAEWDDETGTWFGLTTEDWMVET